MAKVNNTNESKETAMMVTGIVIRIENHMGLSDVFDRTTNPDITATIAERDMFKIAIGNGIIYAS